MSERQSPVLLYLMFNAGWPISFQFLLLVVVQPNTSLLFKLLSLPPINNTASWRCHLEAMKVFSTAPESVLEFKQTLQSPAWSCKAEQRWREALITPVHNGTWCFCSYSWEDWWWGCDTQILFSVGDLAKKRQCINCVVCGWRSALWLSAPSFSVR